MKYLLIGIIKLYQILPLSCHNYCRLSPTCSDYGIEAISKYGSIKGTYLTVKRIIRCNFKNTKYYDPVPERRKK